MATHGHGETRARTPGSKSIDDWISVYKVPSETIDKVRRIVCSKAHDAKDARLLMDYLGIVPTKESSVRPRSEYSTTETSSTQTRARQEVVTVRGTVRTVYRPRP